MLNLDDLPEPDEVCTCWCGATGTAAELYDRSALTQGGCSGLGMLYCYCGGDSCACHHHGWVECPGCPDCEPEEKWRGDDAC